MVDQITRSIIVKAPVEVVYKLWADFETFPRFMQNIKSVRRTGDTSHWVMEAAAGRDVEWDARTTLMEENSRIAWNSTEGDVDTSGQVAFQKLDDSSCQVTLIINYVPKGPIGALGKLFTDPEKRVEEDLMNFKRIAEETPVQAAM